VRNLVGLLALASGGCTYLLPSLQTIPGCPTGSVLCNNLTCSDLKTDPLNCGFCENACGQGLSCKTTGDGGSACLCTVPDGLFWNGACYDLSNDPRNCGALGLACAATQACLDGGCGCAGASDGGQIVACTTPQGPVCADLRGDPHHCGSCSIDCGDFADCDADAGCVPLDAGAGDAGPDGGALDGGDGGAAGESRRDRAGTAPRGVFRARAGLP